ncbi:hypothetical protein DIE19_24880 [Burkholderia sp. Bp9126]|nr:hypothetical protein DIE19_24880 [Burkholderia sp. Bp9126]
MLLLALLLLPLVLPPSPLLLCDDSLEFSVAAASRLDCAAYSAPPSAVAPITFWEPELLNPDFFDVPDRLDVLADERVEASSEERLSLDEPYERLELGLEPRDERLELESELKPKEERPELEPELKPKEERLEPGLELAEERLELELSLELDDERLELEPELELDDERLELKPELLAKATGAAQPVASAKATSVAATWRRVAFMLLTSLLFKICLLGPAAGLSVAVPARFMRWFSCCRCAVRARVPCDAQAEKRPLSPRAQS